MSNHTTELKAGLSHIAQLFDLGADAPIDHLQAIVGVKEERDDLKVNNSKQNKEINRLKKMLVKSRKENEKLKLLLIPMNDWQEKNGKCAYSFDVYERAIKCGHSYETYSDLMDEVCDDFYHEFCCGTGSRPPKYDITMDYIEDRLKRQKNHGVKFWGFFNLIKSKMEQIEQIKDANGEVFQEGFDAGREEYQVDQEFLDEKDEEIDKLKEDINELLENIQQKYLDQICWRKTGRIYEHYKETDRYAEAQGR